MTRRYFSIVMTIIFSVDPLMGLDSLTISFNWSTPVNKHIPAVWYSCSNPAKWVREKERKKEREREGDNEGGIVLCINCINLLCPSLSESALILHRAPARSLCMELATESQRIVFLTAITRFRSKCVSKFVSADGFDSKSCCFRCYLAAVYYESAISLLTRRENADNLIF